MAGSDSAPLKAIAAVNVAAVDPADVAVQALIGELDSYQLALYPVESNHLDSLATLKADNVHFVGATEDGELVGCGAVKFQQDDGPYAEVKRVFVRTDARGRGVSRQIMAELERFVEEQGVEVIRLETGIYQPEAIALYTRLGYAKRGPFGHYVEDPMSVFMEKRLRSGA